MQVTADRYEDFVCNFDRRIIRYNADLATENFRKRNDYETKLPNIGSPRSSRAYGRSTHRDSDAMRVKMRLSAISARIARDIDRT